MSSEQPGGLSGLSPEQRALFAALLRQEGVDIAAVPVPRKADGAAAPLSFAQERLWYLHQLTQMSPTYNEAVAFRLRGPLDVDALSRGLAELVRRHEILRMRCVERDGELMQEVVAALAFGLSPIEMNDVPPAERAARAIEHVRDSALIPFDLSQAPLWRASLHRLGPDDHLLGLVVHLIVADGWSLRILARDLASLYREIAAGQPPSLPPLPVQYGDFSAWQKRLHLDGMLEGQLDYWRSRLAGLPDLVDLPLDRPRPPMMGFRGRSHQFDLGSALTDAVKATSASLGVTPFTTLLAALHVLLHRYAQQADVAIGTQVSNRSRSEFEGLIGPFGNNLVIRCDCSGDPSFRAIVAQVAETMIAALGHQDVAFDRVVEAVRPRRDLSHYPLFQVEFIVHQDDMRGNLGLPGVEVEQIPIDKGTARFDIDFTLVDGGDVIGGAVGYNADLFDHETIVQVLAHYRLLIEAIVADPDQAIGDIPLLSSHERGWILDRASGPAVDYPRDACVHDLIERQAMATPKAIAVDHPSGAISYAELIRHAERLSRSLAELGVGPGQVVGVFMDRVPDLVVALLGTWKAGGTALPLDPNFPARRLAGMLGGARATVVIAQPNLASRVPRDGVEVVVLDRGAASGSAEDTGATAPQSSSEALAYVIHTSGSTGVPKAVAVTHRNLVNALTSLAREPGISSLDRMLAVTTTTFDIAFVELILPLIAGATVVLADRDTARDPLALAQRLDESGVTIMQATPATWRMLVAAGWNGRRGLKALCGGETLDAGLAGKLVERVDSLWNLYGPTETTIWSTCQRVTSVEPPISIGRPIANTQVYILDRRGQLVPPGARGEICIGGDGVSRGYVGAPKGASDCFVPDPFRPLAGTRIYRTGDIGRHRRDGTLEFLGRLDDQVKLRGFRIELGEIEAALHEHAAVAEAAVALHEHAPGDPRLVAYVVNKPGTTTIGSELRRFLRAILPDYMLPQLYIEIHALPRRANGKIDRGALPNPFGEATAAVDAFVPPTTPTEQLVAAVWRETLGIERVDAHDNFFNLGGHSLLVVRVVARIAERTGVRLLFRDIVSASLQNIAATVDRQISTTGGRGRAGDRATDLQAATASWTTRSARR